MLRSVGVMVAMATLLVCSGAFAAVTGAICCTTPAANDTYSPSQNIQWGQSGWYYNGQAFNVDVKAHSNLGYDSMVMTYIWPDVAPNTGQDPYDSLTYNDVSGSTGTYQASFPLAWAASSGGNWSSITTYTCQYFVQ